MFARGLAIAILHGALQSYAEEVAADVAMETQSAMIPAADMAGAAVESKMAYADYNGYYYGSSGNVEEYQGWLVSRPLQYGSNSQKIDVLLSTSNKWTILQSKNCNNCYGQAINPAASDTYKL